MEDTFPDLGSLSDKELKDMIDNLTAEENEISYKRRVLHGKIDILRAELVNRLRTKEGGERTLGGVATQVLVRAHDAAHGWRFVSFQMTPQGEQAWGSLPSEAAAAPATPVQ